MTAQQERGRFPLPPVLHKVMTELEVWAVGHRSEDLLPSLVGKLCHYTDAQGLFGILENKEMWFTSSSHLNDPTEITFGHQVAREMLAHHRRPPGEDNITSYLADLMTDNIDSGGLGVNIASLHVVRTGGTGTGLCPFVGVPV